MYHMDTMEYYTVIKRNNIIPFAATWMQLEIITLSKSEREIQIYITYMLIITYGTNEPIY